MSIIDEDINGSSFEIMCRVRLKQDRLTAVQALLNYVYADIPEARQTPLIAALQEIKHRLTQ